MQLEYFTCIIYINCKIYYIYGNYSLYVMTKTIFVFYLFCFFFIHGLSASGIRETEVDSLLLGKKFETQEKILDSLINRYNISNPTIGLKLSKRYAELVKNSDNIYHQGVSKYHLGLSYEMIGEFEKSLDYLFAARDIFTGTKYKKKLATVYNELGMVYSEQSDDELVYKSLDYFYKFLEISLEIDDKMEIAGAYSNLGYVYSNLNYMDSALFYHERSLKLRLDMNNKRVIGISYSNLGEAYLKRGDYRIALEYFTKAKTNYEEINYSWGLYEVYKDIARLFLKQQMLDSTKNYAFKLLDVCHEIKSKSAYKTTYYFLADYYRQISDFKTSLTYYELSALYRDSINSESTRNKLVQMQTMYELDKKDQAIELLEQKNLVKQKWVITIVVGGLIIIFIIVYVLYLVSAKRKKEKALFKTKNELHIKNEDLNKEKLEKSKLIEEELKQSILYKSKQLSTHALHMIQKNSILQEIQNEVKDLSKKAITNEKPRYKRISHQINQSLRADSDWDVFRLYFEDVNKNFFSYLKNINPDLTTNDLRLCALIKLNMNSKEMASVLNIAPNSIKSARYRLKKKLNLDIEADLEEFIRRIE